MWNGYEAPYADAHDCVTNAFIVPVPPKTTQGSKKASKHWEVWTPSPNPHKKYASKADYMQQQKVLENIKAQLGLAMPLMAATAKKLARKLGASWLRVDFFVPPVGDMTSPITLNEA